MDVESLWCWLGCHHLVGTEFSSGFCLLCITADLTNFGGVFCKFAYPKDGKPLQNTNYVHTAPLSSVLWGILGKVRKHSHPGSENNRSFLAQKTKQLENS